MHYNKPMDTKIDSITEQTWETLCLAFPKLVRYNPPIVRMNNRIYRTAGRCFVEHSTIDLSTKLLAKHKHEMLTVILPHEIAHQADYNLNGLPKNNRWHGKTWGVIMAALDLPANPYHNMDI